MLIKWEKIPKTFWIRISGVEPRSLHFRWTAQGILMHAQVWEPLGPIVTNIPFLWAIFSGNSSSSTLPLWRTWSILQVKIWSWILPFNKRPRMASDWFTQHWGASQDAGLSDKLKKLVTPRGPSYSGYLFHCRNLPVHKDARSSSMPDTRTKLGVAG